MQLFESSGSRELKTFFREEWWRNMKQNRCQFHIGHCIGFEFSPVHFFLNFIEIQPRPDHTAMDLSVRRILVSRTSLSTVDVLCCPGGKSRSLRLRLSILESWKWHKTSLINHQFFRPRRQATRYVILFIVAVPIQSNRFTWRRAPQAWITDIMPWSQFRALLVYKHSPRPINLRILSLLT